MAWGLLAAVGLASYFLMSGSTHETALPPLALAGGGLVVGAIAFAVLGVTGVLPMEFHERPRRSWAASRCRGGSRCSSSA